MADRRLKTFAKGEREAIKKAMDAARKRTMSGKGYVEKFVGVNDMKKRMKGGK